MDHTALILDIGTFLTRGGFTDYEDGPRTSTPTLLGKIRNPNHVNINFFGLQPAYFGEQARAKRGVLCFPEIIHPNGTIARLTDYETMIKLIFEDFHVPASQQPLILIVPPNWTSDCHSVVKYLIEQLKVEWLSVINSSIAALLSQSLPNISPIITPHALSSATGVVVHMGHTTTYISVYHKGKLLYQTQPDDSSTPQLPNGQLFDSIMDGILLKYDVVPVVRTEYEERTYMKQKCACIVPTSPSIDPITKELVFNNITNLKKSVTLQSDVFETTIELINHEFLYLTEALFYPSAVHKISDSIEYQYPSLQSSIITAIKACPESLQLELLPKILLTGGVTNTDGFAERLTVELRKEVVKHDFCEIADVAVRASHQHLAMWYGTRSLFDETNAMETFCIDGKKYMELDDDAEKNLLVDQKRIVEFKSMNQQGKSP